MPLSLADLTHPYPVRRFLDEVWSKTLFTTASRPDLAEEICQDFNSNTLEGFLKLAQEPVLVMHYTRARAYRSTPVSAATALSFFEAGATLYFHLRPTLRPVRALAQQLSSDLGIDAQFIRISLFASPAGAVTEWHFDANENFTVHLTGKKRWLVSPATTSNPIERFTATSMCPPSLSQYEPQLREDVRHVEERATAVDMLPGTTLYVPRAAWHRVDALADSTSLNLCVTPETWEHVVLAALRKRLLADSRWREIALGIRGGEARDGGLRERCDAMLAHLAMEATRLTLDDVAGVPEAAEAGQDPIHASG
ncbi:MAG TPA: cupin-like domain-containing protein [Gammaproteobacteria bacterium]|nr:cupin-like domain-containing protein [Gammaproteobacteria bacterium]